MNVAEGRGALWVTGFAVLAVVGLAAAVVLPKMQATNRAKAEMSALGTLRSITTAQTLFREADKEMDTNFDYGTLAELSETGLLEGLSNGAKQGYVFAVSPSPTTSEFLWTATANPEVPGSTGDAFFGTNQSGVLFTSNSGPVTFNEQCQVTGDAQPTGIGGMRLR